MSFLEILDGLGQLIELLRAAFAACRSLLRAAFAAWRYLLSPSYRWRTHDRWRSASRLSVFFDILGALIAFLFTLALGIALAVLLGSLAIR